jgi:hypothetical protein
LIWPFAASPHHFALTDPRLGLIDHEGRHLIEEFPKNLFGLFRQCSFSKSTIHQAHPSIAGGLIYVERKIPRAQAWSRPVV